MHRILRRTALQIIKDNRRQSQAAADHAVGDLRLVRDKRCADQQDHHENQEPARFIVCNLCPALCLHRLPERMEQDHHDRNRGERAEFDGEKDSGTAFHPEEFHKIHLRVRAEHDRGRIADQGCGALQIGRNRDGQNHGNRRNLQLFADGNPDRRHHEDGRDIVDKSGDHSGEKRHVDNDPHDIFGLIQQEIRNQVRHFRFYEEINQNHGSRNHQKNIPVDRFGQYGNRKNSRNEKQNCRAEYDPDSDPHEQGHENIHGQKQYDRQYLQSHFAYSSLSSRFTPAAWPACPAAG